MYTKDKKYDLHLRLNARQYNFLKGTAEEYGISPAELIRIIIDSAQYNQRKEKDENIETDINDIV